MKEQKIFAGKVRPSHQLQISAADEASASRRELVVSGGGVDGEKQFNMEQTSPNRRGKDTSKNGFRHLK